MQENNPLLSENQPPAGAPPPLASASQPPAAEHLVLPVLEERATVQRELVETGRVRLTKTVTEHTETVPLDLRHDEVTVEHVALNQLLPEEAPAPGTRYEGETLVIPVLREVLVKRVLLVEELRVTRRQRTTHEAPTVLLRHEQILEEHLPAAAPPEGARTA